MRPAPRTQSDRPLSSPGRLRSAFTLVELVIVVMLLGVLAGIAAPKYTDALAAVNLDAASKRLAADIRRARAHAIDTGQRVEMTFEPVADTYFCSQLTDPSRPDQVLDVTTANLFDGVQIQVANFVVAGTLAFDWRGQPDGPGTVVLSAGGMMSTVSIGELGGVEVSP